MEPNMTRWMVRSMRGATLALLAMTFARAAAAQQPAQAQQLKFAFLDSRAVLAATPGRPEAESLFAREMVGFRGEVSRLQAQLDSAVQEYQRSSAAMTPTARANRERELRDMDTRTRARATELDQQAQQREQQLTAPIMQRVTAVIEGVRAEFNFTFIFDVSAQGNPIVAADRTLDITQLVIQRLQAAGPGPAPDAAAAPGAVQPAAQPPLAPAPRDTTRPLGPAVRPRPSRP
ncbi:MAG: OmpH family outer membrane protein [Gemmatimonadales bacterium]